MVPRSIFGSVNKHFLEVFRNTSTIEVLKNTPAIGESVSVKNTSPATYTIADTKGESIKGTFYEQELQKTKQEIYRIEKVVKKRKRNGIQEVYVKWKGYNSDFNSWIPLADLERRDEYQ